MGKGIAGVLLGLGGWLIALAVSVLGAPDWIGWVAGILGTLLVVLAVGSIVADLWVSRAILVRRLSVFLALALCAVLSVVAIRSDGGDTTSDVARTQTEVTASLPEKTLTTLFVPATGTEATGPIGSLDKFKMGSCGSRSWTDPNRSTARVCKTPEAPGRSFGPCFKVPDKYAEVECFATPWDTVEASGITYQFARASFEEATLKIRGGLRGDPVGWDKPWTLRLRGGALCLHYLGKRHRPSGAPAGRIVYECRGDAVPWITSTGTVFFWDRRRVLGWVMEDYPNQEQPLWTVAYARRGKVRQGTEERDVLEAWK